MSSSALARAPGAGAAVRLNDPPVEPKPGDIDNPRLTQQQRNFLRFVQQQREREEAARAQAEAEAALKAQQQDGEEGEHSVAEEEEAVAPPAPGVSSDHLPLFVIDGFNVENASKHGTFLNVLVSWASEMSAAGVARFMFLSDQALEEQVTKALPDIKVAEVLLADASPEAAREFLFNALPPEMRRNTSDSDTVAALQILGGRYADLQACVRGIENGTHPIETVEEIVISTMNNVKSNFLFTEDKNAKW